MARVQLAIIGGGLVGASLALALQAGAKARGWQIVLIEPFAPGNSYQPSYDARSTALSYGTRQIYQRLGIWPSISQRAEPITQIHVSDRGCFGFLQQGIVVAAVVRGQRHDLLLHLGLVEYGAQLLGEALVHGCRHAFGCEQAHPRGRDIAGHTRFSDGRDLRRELGTRGTGDGQRLDSAGLDVRRHGRQVDDGDRYLSAQQVVDGRRTGRCA